MSKAQRFGVNQTKTLSLRVSDKTVVALIAYCARLTANDGEEYLPTAVARHIVEAELVRAGDLNAATPMIRRNTRKDKIAALETEIVRLKGLIRSQKQESVNATN